MDFREPGARTLKNASFFVKIKKNRKNLKTMTLDKIVRYLGLLAFLWACPGSSIEWKYSYYLDNNFLVLWTPGENDVTFEIQVKTLGYVGLGFTRNDRIEEIDIVIGWVDDNGQVHLQVGIDLRLLTKAIIQSRQVVFSNRVFQLEYYVFSSSTRIHHQPVLILIKYYK